jgi:signal transduction histidine kinase
VLVPRGTWGACATQGYTPVIVLPRCNRPYEIVRAVASRPTLHKPLSEVLLPRPTVRWRLTLLYSLLFVICGAALLGITYYLFQRFAFNPPKRILGPDGRPIAQLAKVPTVVDAQRAIGLHRLQVYSGIALGIMAIVSVVLGWLVAGRVLGPLRTITATTERISERNLHERLAMSGPQDELRLLADTIDRLLERLEAAFEAQRRFVANASHELRTPLAMMRTTLDVAIGKPSGVPPQMRELDAELRVDLDHADELLESFLALARAQNERVPAQDQVALEPLITDALCARTEQIATKRLAVETHLSPVEVAGSPTLLARMVENVIENAVRHNQPNGSIELTLAPLGGQQARFTVDSSGPVLAQHAVAELAQPFKRLGPDRIGSQNGHGLGLSIVAAVAAAHNGSLELHARPEGGLRVSITLRDPATQEPAGATR